MAFQLAPDLLFANSWSFVKWGDNSWATNWSWFWFAVDMMAAQHCSRLLAASSFLMKSIWEQIWIKIETKFTFPIKCCEAHDSIILWSDWAAHEDNSSFFWGFAIILSKKFRIVSKKIGLDLSHSLSSPKILQLVARIWMCEPELREE